MICPPPLSFPLTKMPPPSAAVLLITATLSRVKATALALMPPPEALESAPLRMVSPEMVEVKGVFVGAYR